MPKKDESSGDEFVPSGEEENSAPENQGSDEEEEAEQEDDFDPYQPRKAKLNRKNIVESEDSDKLSTDPDNSDEYDPDEKKSKMKRSAKHADSDSDDQPKFTPSPKKKKIVQRRRRPPRRRPVSESDTEDSASTATESESDEAEASDKSPAAPAGNTVVDQLQAKFPDVPRSDITRVYYQSSCQMDKAIAYLTNEYSPSKFSKPKVENGSRRVPANGPDLSEESEESEDENEKTNLQSEEDQESEDEKPVVKNKRKALNSSDEEWCPAAKKQKTKSSKKKAKRQLSSSDDDERPSARREESDMSDGGVDDDYSEDEKPVKRSASAEKPLLKFLNSASAPELAILKSFSDKKIEIVMELRPFSSFLDIKKKIEAYKSDLKDKRATVLNSFNIDSLADSVEEFLKGRDMVVSLLKKCQSMGKNVTRGLQREGGGLMIEKPSLMADHLVLKDYQKRGLHWYTQIHQLKIGGILADEMGLGKTVQTISFFAWLKEHYPNFTKPHLVVCPSSTMDNWKREFECWLPSFKIFMYHGEDRRHHLKRIIKAKSEPHKADDSHKDIDVIITTYTSSNSHEADRVGIKKLGVGYAIFDEGHMLKNMNTNRYQQLMRIGARRRVLLTGTPLQNNLLVGKLSAFRHHQATEWFNRYRKKYKDSRDFFQLCAAERERGNPFLTHSGLVPFHQLISLIKFLMPDLLQKSSNTLQRIFKLRNQESEFAKKQVAECRTILQPFILRRVKSEVLKDLPPKTSEELYVDLTDQQKMFYMEIKDLLRCKLSTTEKKEQGIRDIRNHFIQLRKVANHPLLHRNHYTPDILRKMARTLCDKELKKEGNVDYVYEDLEVMSDFQIHETCEKYASLKKYRLKKDDILNSGKFKVLDELLPKLFDQGHRVLLFSQFVIMMDIMERYLTARKIKYMRLDGSTPVEDRLDMIDTFNADSDINLFMVSTRAGGLGINLTSADTVIIHDIDPNPYNDKQAEDRCHRVGQTKPVKIIRLIVKDTIEVRMRKLAVDKLALESKMDMNDRMVYGEGEKGPVEAEDEDSNDVSQAEMLDLLSDSPKPEVVKEEECSENEAMKVDQLTLDTQSQSSSIKTEAEGEKEPLREVQPNGS